jgi:dynein heavy chain
LSSLFQASALRCHLFTTLLVLTAAAQIEAFAQHMPLIRALRTDGMKQRHWDELRDSTGRLVAPDSDTTLAEVLRMQDLVPHLDVLQRVAARASEEYRVERQLEEMQFVWNTVTFTLLPLRCVARHLAFGHGG